MLTKKNSNYIIKKEVTIMNDNIATITTKECNICINNTHLKFLINCSGSGENQEGIISLTNHMHLHAELFTCDKGEVKIEVPNQTINLFPGDAVIIPASVPHSRFNLTDDTFLSVIGIVWTKISCKEAPDTYSEISSFLSSKKPIIIRNKPELCKALDKLVTSINDDNELRLTLMFANEFIKLIDKKSTQNEHKSKGDVSIKNIDRLVKLDYILNTKFMTSISNKQIASELFISERQLSRLVCEHYGSTLHALIINKRIETAANLLEKTNYSADSIAHLVGFKSKTVFYSDFYKVYGITPNEYRQKKTP